MIKSAISGYHPFHWFAFKLAHLADQVATVQRQWNINIISVIYKMGNYKHVRAGLFSYKSQ